MIAKLTAILRERVENIPSVITEDMSLISDLGLNSLDLVDLACAVEDEFDIEIPDRAIKDLRTVGDVIHYIDTH